MITIRTGELFVEKYNEEMKTNFTPKEIFCILAEKAFKDINRQMINWTNSKFFHRYNNKKPSFEQALEEFCNDLENKNYGVETTLNVYGGCGVPKKCHMRPTEFNYCDNLHFTIDERYCSFIGGFFQIGVQNFVTVINNKNIIWELYHSFNEYYKFIHENSNFKDKQLSTWNGCYLYQIIKKQDEFIINKKTNNNKLKTIDFLEYLDAISRIEGCKIRNILFESFDQTNVSCGYITIDLNEVKGWFNIFDKIIVNYDENFDIEDYAKFFSKKGLLRMAFDAGEITSNMLDPLLEFRKEKEQYKRINNEARKFLNKYLEYIMTAKEMDLAKQFGHFLNEAPNNCKKKPSVTEERKNIFSSRNLTRFGEAILDFCKKVDFDPSVGVPYDVITYFSTDNNSFRLDEFLMYTQFNK